MSSEPRSNGSSLSEEQAAFLVDSGAFTPNELAETQASIAQGKLEDAERTTRLDAIRATYCAEEVADLLGTSTQRVESDRVEGTLYAFGIKDEWRYPFWQFTGDPKHPVVPGIEVLADSTVERMHPASVLGFMTTPQSSARIGGEPVTPVEWLLSGGDPDLLRGILSSFLMT